MPSSAIRKHPVRKLRFFRMCRSTRPLGLDQERQIQPISAKTSAATAQRTQTAPNQSSSWPLSSTICRHPVQTIEQAEADVVEGAYLGVLDVRRVVDKPADHEERQDPDGKIDVERVAPAEGIGEPASERRSQDRRDDDTEAIGRHGLGTLLHREAFEQNRLRQRLQRAAARPLQDASQQHDRERGSGSAEERRNRKDDDAGEQKRLRPKRRANQFAAGRITALATR